MAKKKSGKKSPSKKTSVKYSFTQAMKGDVPDAKKHKISVFDYRKQVTMLVTFAVIIGFIFGFYLSLFFLKEKAPVEEHDHGDHDHATVDAHHDHNAHAHDTLDVAAQTAPDVMLTVVKDSKSGYNIVLNTQNFVFTPQNVNKGHVDGEGHAHLYVNGEKVARMYSSNYHLDGLDPGMYDISVTLNTNNHYDYAVEGVIVEDSLTLTVE